MPNTAPIQRMLALLNSEVVWLAFAPTQAQSLDLWNAACFDDGENKKSIVDLRQRARDPGSSA